MGRRKGDLMRISLLSIGILVLFLSWAVVLHAQSDNEANQRFKDIEAQQKVDEAKVNDIDKRLVVIETKQDFNTWLLYGLGAGIGALLLERVKVTLFAPARRRHDDEE